MKRKYRKPMVVFENFSLSTNIAGDCEIKTNLPSNKTCGLEFGIEIVFNGTVSTGCTFNLEDGGSYGPWDKICYHVPNDNSELFNS